ncbi:hypothetical protein [Pseudomonas sp. Marseille-P8916]|nr:hypothetical protein [Pseudomonas sp. Marseille-P8916]
MKLLQRMLKCVVELVCAADFLAKLANIYRAWVWLRDHVDQ